jgi:hypothetical protein
MSNHRLVGSKGCALGGSRAEPWPYFLPWFPRAGNGHEVSALGGSRAEPLTSLPLTGLPRQETDMRSL